MRSTRTMILAERRRDLNAVANFEIAIEAFRKACLTAMPETNVRRDSL